MRCAVFLLLTHRPLDHSSPPQRDGLRGFRMSKKLRAICISLAPSLQSLTPLHFRASLFPSVSNGRTHWLYRHCPRSSRSNYAVIIHAYTILSRGGILTESSYSAFGRVRRDGPPSLPNRIQIFITKFKKSTRECLNTKGRKIKRGPKKIGIKKTSYTDEN